MGANPDNMDNNDVPLTSLGSLSLSKYCCTRRETFKPSFSTSQSLSTRFPHRREPDINCTISSTSDALNMSHMPSYLTSNHEWFGKSSFSALLGRGVERTGNDNGINTGANDTPMTLLEAGHRGAEISRGTQGTPYERDILTIQTSMHTAAATSKTEPPACSEVYWRKL